MSLSAPERARTGADLSKDEYYFWLCSLPSIGVEKSRLLFDYFHTVERIYYAAEKELKNIKGLSEKNISMISNKDNKEIMKKQYHNLQQKGIYFVSKENTDYPERLKQIYGAPLGLFVKGHLPCDTRGSIAIVGARNCSGYGREMAKYFAKELSRYKIQVISGLARGIDSSAHKGALSLGGDTYGVLGCGIDICYPKENIELYMELPESGGILSEYGVGIPPLPGLFPMRNRIISGLADGILVIEAKEKSGSLITADLGLEQGKEIYALPGRIDEALSAGCNNLLKMGAKLVTSPGDIIEDYISNYHWKVQEMKKNNNLLETKEKIVYANLSFNPKHLEVIIQETGLRMETAVELLVQLQLKNLIKQAGNYYSLITEESIPLQ